jgi:putative tryptophan/tyrosine transport system substrate-binding protein
VAAQEPIRAPLIAVLDTDAPAQSPNFGAFREGLRDVHYVEGRDVRIVVRSSWDHRSLHALAGEIVALKPDVIVSANSATTRAFKGVGGTIPVVMVLVFDPWAWAWSIPWRARVAVSPACR